MPEPIRLYDSPVSGNCYKVRLILALLGVTCERVEMDIFAGETRTPSFLARNPNGRVPVLELDDGSCLAESNAILFFLAEETRFMPACRLARARVMQWMFFEQYDHEPAIAVARALSLFAPPDDRNLELIMEKQVKGNAALDVMERHLAANDYFVDTQYSIADIALFAYTHIAHEGGFDLTKFRYIRAWIERVEAQQGHIAMIDVMD